MKKFIAVLIGLGLIICFIIIHSLVIVKLTKDIDQLADSVYTKVMDNNWREAEYDINEIEEKWNSRRLWTNLTIDTNKIEEIEISLRQSQKFIAEQEKADFIDKFTMFSNLIDQLPNQEGLSIENLL